MVAAITEPEPEERTSTCQVRGIYRSQEHECFKEVISKLSLEGRMEFPLGQRKGRHQDTACAKAQRGKRLSFESM